jgi:uncharacterized repeat protein (TIGR03803 family)
MTRKREMASLFQWTGLAAVALFTATLGATPADAAEFRVLHSFCKAFNCVDGYSPSESLALDESGNLYGTAQGGAHDSGIVFELVAPIAGNKWRYKVLYHFCARSNCADGASPDESTLVIDTAGNIYGTTSGGGAGNNAGTVFKLSPPVKGNHWRLQTLYSFCVKVSSCHDGQNPGSGLTYAGLNQHLPYDGSSPLFGATTSGGGRFSGVAYSMTPLGTGKWREHVLYAFCHHGTSACSNGRDPAFQLTLDAHGNLYGNTWFGGVLGDGVAFKLSPDGGHERMTETVLYNFCDFCSESGTTLSGLTLDGDGNMFGASWRGGTGAHCPSPQACGLIYRIAQDGSETIAYAFCALPNCQDGSEPLNQGGLLMDTTGALYGTTGLGGTHSVGTVFRFNGTTLETLHNFCGEKDCVDGSFPRGGVIEDASNQIFGTTQYGGAYNGGTVFELTP